MVMVIITINNVFLKTTRCSWNAQRSEDTPRFVEACCFMNTAIKLPCCLSFSVLVNSGDLE